MSETERPPGDQAKPASVLRETDGEALKLARTLVRGARHAALAVLSLADGAPTVSRVLTATDINGVPTIITSRLSAHTGGLLADPRASLLFGEPGKGDPLAHPRITVQCRAELIAPEAADRAALRRRFLSRHPKAELYIDFPDFCFFRLLPERASLNGGFGRAYALEGSDLVIHSPATAALAEMEADAIAHMNQDHADAIDLYARAFARQSDSGWRLTGIDCAGLDIAKGDRLLRVEFDSVLQEASRLRQELAAMAKAARQTSNL
jgi:putative heme iron utilization protein